ncbi:MAG: threonine synthase [Pseudomonadota bacterium]
MTYISTRGGAAPIDFRKAVTSGLAPDGGLYMPSAWPRFAPEAIAAAADGPFAATASRVMKAFAETGGGGPDATLIEEAMDAAFASFDHDDVAPLRELSPGRYVLELFHGPTLAFKDVAMQALARLYPWALEGGERRKTILAATSGDTGGAAIAAFAGAPGVDVFVFHPQGRISEVQRRIMTTTGADNVRNFAVEGDFDDCQRIVKELFVDPDLSRSRDLGGVNSINWVRLAIQTTYYFVAGARLGAPGVAASYVVPTGNFGDVFAGYAAKRMGLPVARLGVAVNRNDIVHRALSTGVYEPSEVAATDAPSMDIQVASNFERLLFEAMDRDADRLSDLMAGFARAGRMEISADALARIKENFVSARADDAQTAAMIKSTYDSHGYLIDPHTAIGLVAAEQLADRGLLVEPIVTLSTAHPAKFPEAVARASGVTPSLPPRYADLFDRSERCAVLPARSEAARNAILAQGEAHDGA